MLGSSVAQVCAVPVVAFTVLGVLGLGACAPLPELAKAIAPLPAHRLQVAATAARVAFAAVAGGQGCVLRPS
eukprot:11706917-Alexandrium_andersonii.AAC.1